MNIDIASEGFAAVGSAPRLSVVALLVRAGPQGLTTGEIQKKSGIPASTLAHHLKSLAEGRVITQVKNGRSMVSVANFDHLNALAAFLLEECCVDAGEGNENG
ncbi:MAG: ArsR family transcriptional regulator [Rhodobacteraceae bacterium]|nr:ArsR family transcriptional regulator [Paracoccaceae bacterium]